MEKIMENQMETGGKAWGFSGFGFWLIELSKQFLDLGSRLETLNRALHTQAG